MGWKPWITAFGSLLWLAVPAAGQDAATGTLTGRVSAGGQPLPGATVTLTSPSLPAPRQAIAGGEGAYRFPLLTPASYRVRFEVEGFNPQERTIEIAAAKTSTLDAELSLAGPLETIELDDRQAVAISSSSEASVTYSRELFLDGLPVERDLHGAMLLAPGAHDNSPAAGITLAGARSFENLFLIDGVELRENLPDPPIDPLIWDAVEEITTTTSGISAEYGRFVGGVINVITRLGGNQLSGSFRTSITRDR